MRIAALLIAASALLAPAEELKLWGKITFEEAGLSFSANREILPMPAIPGNEAAKSYLALRAYPTGEKSRLRPLELTAPGVDGSGRAIGFPEVRARQLLLLVDHVGEIHSSPELYASFSLYVPPECRGSFSVGTWNYTKKKSWISELKTRPGWNFFRIRLHADRAVDSGDLLKGISIRATDEGVHRWKVDNIVIWQGTDTEKPSGVSEVAIRKEKENIKLSWSPASDNLAVAKYRIYRGTVEGFSCDAETLVGESPLPEYSDPPAMRNDYFYRVTAVDCAGREGAPSPAVGAVSGIKNSESR